MYVINARNVEDALVQGVQLFKKHGVKIPSRNGDTLELPEPVTTVYQRPWERVITFPSRDANPFFHFFESLWMLAGRNDVKFMSEFNANIANYSDDGKIFNAAYGYRARYKVSIHQDQIKRIVSILRKDPNSRQAVCQLWDDSDLTIITKDKVIT